MLTSERDLKYFSGISEALSASYKYAPVCNVFYKCLIFTFLQFYKTSNLIHPNNFFKLLLLKVAKTITKYLKIPYSAFEKPE